MVTLNEKILHDEALLFLDLLFSDIDKNLEIPRHWDIDHLCYRTESVEQYEHIKKIFNSFSALLIESPVNGRMIATYKLNNPICFRGWKINLIEIPSPKLGKKTSLGFEHIEMVCDEDLFELQKKYAHLNLDTGGLKKSFNKELEIIFGERNLKFHNYSLESVIRLEKKSHLHKILSSVVLTSLFQNFNALLVGTPPLDLDVENSDIDIILKADADELLHLLQSHITSEFIKTANNTFNFELHSVPIQIYLCKEKPTSQQSYQHFQAEEKILKYCRSLDLANLKKLRECGVKTEKAFTQILKLHGDEYETMSNLNKIPISDLDGLLNSN